jgi:hypothetical protein
MLLRYAYHKPFTVKFPNKREWHNEINPDNWYTDKSKTNTGTGDGDYRWDSRRGTASVLGSTPWYSRLKYMPLTFM